MFLKFGIVTFYETLQTVSKAKINMLQMKIFNEITPLFFVIYSFMNFFFVAMENLLPTSAIISVGSKYMQAIMFFQFLDSIHSTK